MEADAAADAGDPLAEAAALAAALRAALAAAHPPLAVADAVAIRAGAGGDAALLDAAAQLEALDWIRYSDELGHPDRRAVESRDLLGDPKRPHVRIGLQLLRRRGGKNHLDATLSRPIVEDA